MVSGWDGRVEGRLGSGACVKEHAGKGKVGEVSGRMDRDKEMKADWWGRRGGRKAAR